MQLPTAGAIQVTSPHGRDEAEAATTSPATDVIVTDTYSAGIYRWQGVGEAKREGAFAVNPPAEESDLTAVKPTDLQNAVRNCLVAGSLEDLSTMIADLDQGKPLWDYLLAATLVIVIIETALANRVKPLRE